MKSAYELAMERLNAADPNSEKSLTEAQKEELSDLDNKYRARTAERKIALEAAQVSKCSRCPESLRESLMNAIWSYGDTLRRLLFRDSWQNKSRVNHKLAYRCLIICSVLLVITSCASPDSTESLEPAHVDPTLTAESDSPSLESIPIESPSSNKDVEASTSDSTTLANSSSTDDDDSNELSEEVRQRLVDAIAKDLSQPMETLTIETVTPQTWPNGCLGLGTSDELCTMALVNGWQVTIKTSDTVATYRSNANGTVVRRES